MKLKNILHYIGVLVLFITTLLGWLYLNGNDTVIYAVIIGVILMFGIYYLVSLMVKKRKETHVNLAHVISLWVVYIAIAVFSAILSLHSITIQFLANDNLRENGNQKLAALNELRTEFTASRSEIKGQLESEVLQLLESYSHADDKTTLKQSLKDTLINKYEFNVKKIDKMKNMRVPRNDWIEIYYDRKIDEFYSDIDKELLDYYNKNKNTFDKNDFLNINKVYYELDSVLIRNKSEIENNFSELINKYDVDENIYDDKIIPESTVSLNNLSELRKQYSPLKYIIFYLIIHLLILSPFLLISKKGLKPKATEDKAMEL